MEEKYFDDLDKIFNDIIDINKQRQDVILNQNQEIYKAQSGIKFLRKNSDFISNESESFLVNYLDMLKINFGLIYEEDRKDFSNLINLQNMASSSTAITTVIATSINFTKDNDKLYDYDYFKNISKLDDKIQYLKEQIKIIKCDVLADFEHFLNMYYSSKPDKYSYIELIGCRSLLFFKFIFFISELLGNKNTKDRKSQIATFVFGKNNYNNIADVAIQSTYDLYGELSNQDKDINKNSIKLGNISTEYSEVIFIKIINTLFSLIKLRETFYM
jgi:hypothetical protein